MNDSEKNVVTGAETKPNVTEQNFARTQGLASLSEWAEFSFLIQKLDGEFAESLDYPPESALGNSDPTDN